MPDKPPRFEARSRVIRDEILPIGSKLLYCLLDDIGFNGECLMRQSALADQLSVSDRSIRTWIAALERAGYVVLDRRQYRTRYILGWFADRNVASSLSRTQTGRLVPPDRNVASDLTLLGEKIEEKENSPLKCPNCKDTGLVSRLVRGFHTTGFCHCPAGEAARAA